MHNPVHPISWKDVAARYDARSLPFLGFYREAGFRRGKENGSSRVLVRSRKERTS